MRITFLYVVFASLAFSANAQKQGNTWIFGRDAKLDFRTNPPLASTRAAGPAPNVQAISSASISDSAGRLICWTDGRRVFGRYGIMKNGDSVGDEAGIGQHLIIPLPGSDSIFYVFTSRFDEGIFIPSPASYRYSIINACLDQRTPDSVNGDVIAGQKRLLLYEHSTTKLCAAADDQGYWILGHRRYSDSFVAWRLTSTGLSAPVSTRIGPKVGFRSSGGNIAGNRGQMKFSPAGNKIAMVTDHTRNDTSTLDLFDFDRNTGVVSNHCQIPISASGNTLGVEFSPDGSRLYVAHTQTPTAHVLGFQVNNSCAVVNSSWDTLYSRATRNFGSLINLQAGPDGVIYVGRSEPNGSGSSLHRIFSPNSSPRYDTTGHVFGIQQEATGNLPSFVAGFRYKNRVPPCYRFKTTGVSASPSGSIYIELWPNPADAEIRIRTTGLNAANHSLIVTDATGRSMMRTATLPGRIDVSGFPAGMYFWGAIGQAGMVAGGQFVVAH